MKTRSAKSKGRRACAELARTLLMSESSLRVDDILVTPSGVTGDDLRLSPLAQEIFPWNIEVKNVEKLNIWSAIKQVEARKQENRQPILFFTKNRTGMYACVDYEYMVKLTVENFTLKKKLEELCSKSLT